MELFVTFMACSWFLIALIAMLPKKAETKIK